MKVEARIGRQTLSIETGKVAKQADGSVWVRYGDTVVLVAAVSGPGMEGGDFLPLRMDYREMTYAAGKFPGGFYKREGRPTFKEILTSRLMDRPIRPLFPEGHFDEVVVTAIVLSADKENDPDILSMIGASASLAIAPEIPFLGPVGSVRVGKVEGVFVLNPTTAERETSPLDLIVSGTADAVTMLEGQAHEISEEELMQAVLFAQPVIREIVRMQNELAGALGISKAPLAPPQPSPLMAELDAKYFDRVMAAHQVRGKFNRHDSLTAIANEIVAAYLKDAAGSPTEQQLRGLFSKLEEKACRKLIGSGRREDGRGCADVRPISCEVGVLPRVHGSALFTRGETQALATITLGSSVDEQRVDGLLDEYRKKFMLDYNFPPFSVGEARAPRAPSRRELGHGHLAEMALEMVLPPVEQFPYTIRIVSEILESNGSSSMASVCGGSLALMDAGVPINKAVAGIAMGLIKEEGRVHVLTDIVGAEDHFGDMDLKIAGTETGITAVQMDLKIVGIDDQTLHRAFAQAREGRLHILRQMFTALDKPRPAISEHAPRLLMVKINPEKIGAVIGPGGRVIKKIQQDTGATIDIQDDGTVSIACVNAEGAERAREIVLGITEEPEVGKVYHGHVTGIKEFGAFVEILPGRDGLVHISELSDGYIKKVDEVCKLGDEMTVKLLSIDDQGKIRLSRKAILKEQQQQAKS